MRPEVSNQCTSIWFREIDTAGPRDSFNVPTEQLSVCESGTMLPRRPRDKLNAKPYSCQTVHGCDIVLSRREIEVFRWISLGKSDWEVGRILAISPKTVNFHVENVKRKYGVNTRIQAIVEAVKTGLLDQ